MSDQATSYEKQIKWRKMSATRAERLKEQQQLQESDHSFSPSMFSSNVKPMNDGLVKDLYDRSSQRHIERQSKARTQKMLRQSMVLPGTRSSELKLPQSSEVSNHPGSEASIANDFYYGAMHDRDNNSISNSSSSEDEPIIETLERERREWKGERDRLIQCIHLQQLELTQRSVAAHERAVDIAKEFARAIEGFEERLLSVEMNVQKEIVQIKNIAESLLAASKQSSSLHSKH